MIRNRINKIVIISVLIISLLICNFGFVYAEDIVEDETIPTIYSDNQTIQQGSYFTSYIKTKDFKDIGSFELFIYYDTEVLSLSTCNTSTLLSNEYVSINKDTPGEIRVYVASVNGINGSGNLLNLRFNIKNNAPIGISKVIIAVGDANFIDLSSVEIQTSSFNVDVIEKPVSKNTINFSANNVDTMTYNSSFNIKYYISSFTYNFSSAEFLITYDSNLLKYEEIKIGDSLNKLNGSLVSVNSGNKGIIKVTFAALEGVSNYLSSTNYLFDIKFTVINNVDDNAFVTITSSQMYDINLNQIYANSYTKNIKVDKKLSYIGFDDFKGYDKEFVLEMKASKGLNLAAGDFIINYSKYNLSCLSLEKTIDSSMIVYNIIKDSNGNETGKIKFSFLLSGGVVYNDIICKIHFKPKQSGSFNISLSGSGLKDGNYKDISLSYLDTKASINITHEYQKVEYLAPTCTTKGHEEHKKCINCDYSPDKVTISSLGGHLYVSHNAKAPTCTEIGWNEYDTCSRCDYSTYSERPKLGHNYNSVVTKPTCLDNGYTTHTCNVCYDTYNDNYTDAIGHNYGEVFYTWSEDHLSLKAKHICINDESHYEEETVRAEYKVVTNPTCEEDGLGTYISNEFTNKSFVKQTYEVVLSKLGHNYNKCNSNNDSTHTYICSNDISHIEVKACKFGNWIVVNEPGTFTKGLEKRVCEECKYEEFREIPELHEHQYSNEFTIDKEATCTEDGLKSKHCTVDNCSSSIEETSISKLNHNYSVVTYEWSTDYSKVTAFTKCINDESHILKETVDTVYSVIKTPTCKEEGIGIYSTKAFTNEIFSEQTYEVTISKVNHSLEKHNAKEATCIEIGWNEYVTCTNCDYTTYEEIAILEHMYEDVVVEPTCTDKGYTKHICSRCHDEYTDNYIEKTNHTESDWIVDKEPTTESVGQKHTECVVCGETIKTDTIPTIEKSGCALFSVARMISLMNIFVVVYIIRKKIFR